MGYDNCMRADVMISMGIFDDIPYKFVKDFNSINNPIIAVVIEDICFTVNDVIKTRFTFNLSFKSSSGEYIKQTFIHICEYKMNTNMADTIRALYDYADDCDVD
jgi:hypothetical protein